MSKARNRLPGFGAMHLLLALGGAAAAAWLSRPYLEGWLKEDEPARAPVEVDSTRAARTSVSRESEQAFLDGVVFYQKGDFEKARKRWSEAVRLDPANADAAAGLARLDSLYGVRG